MMLRRKVSSDPSKGSLFLHLLDVLGRRRFAGFYISLSGVLLAAAFAFLVYPRISSPMDMTLDPDAYRLLGHGIWKNGSLSFFPDTDPTIRRGPLYPAFLASILAVSGGWYPYAVQAAQCALFGLTCWLVFRMSEIFWDRRTAILASTICCFNPILIWFTGRIWAEVLLFLLLSLLFASMLSFVQRPSIYRSFLVGLVLGLLILCKQTFLPFLVLLPVLLFFIVSPAHRRLCLGVFCLAVVMVLPWTVRNWRLTGKIIPVHSSAGVQMQLGDKHLEDQRSSSFLTYEMGPRLEDEVNAMIPPMPRGLTKAQRDVLGNAFLLKSSLDRYKREPAFFLRKLAMNAYMFWFSGSSIVKSVGIMVIKLPILVFFTLFCIRIIRRREIKTIHGVNITLVWLYFVLHLPFFAVARYSSILIPIMGMYAVRYFLIWLTGATDGAELPEGNTNLLRRDRWATGDA